MSQTTPPPTAARRARRLLGAAVAWLVVGSIPLTAQNATPPVAAAGALSALRGYVIDSVHNVPLVGATVTVEGTGRTARTSDEGSFLVDSIPPGSHRVLVVHPLLDTLGVQMRTPAYTFVAGQTHDIDMAIPGGERLASALCTPAQLRRGPALMLGFVRDPDTNGPALGSTVSLVYEGQDILGRKTPATKRDAPVDSTGLYRICGIPADMKGKVQVFRNGVSSGEVPVEVTNGLALRAFSIVAHQVVAEVKDDSGKITRVAKGTARLTGTVTDKLGRPLDGARVMLQGGAKMAVTRTNGEFSLDSLPSGTQAIIVRRLGYGITEAPVELSSAGPNRTTVKMEDYVPTLAAVRVEAAQDKALSDIGYLQRKQMGMGYFMDGDQINHESLAFSDVMRMAPGLRVQPAGDGRSYVITDSRSAGGGCVNYYVDGAPWQTLTPGDIDQMVRPNEMVAVEVYHGSQAPPQYTVAGQSSCAVIVIWTVARVRPSNASKRP